MIKHLFLKRLPATTASIILQVVAVAGASAQIPHFGAPVAAHPAPEHQQFADFTSAAIDPADQVCARYATGSTVNDPAALHSVNGTLEVYFSYQTATDTAGLKRYCYIYTNSSGVAYTDGSGNPIEAPTLHMNAGDKLLIHFFNNQPSVAAASASSPMHGMVMKPDAASASSDCSATSVTSSSTNLHFHGTNVSPVCHQDEVLHTLIAAQQRFDYQVQIPANEPPGVFWYHPHAHGYSDPQLIGGASGALIVDGIQNINSAVASLPERTLVLRDQNLPASDHGQPSLPATDLSINYVPVVYNPATFPVYTPAVIQAAPSEKEFWRVLNAAADTLLDIQVQIGGVAQPLQVVAIDGVPLTDSNNNAITKTQTDILMPSATRVEFILTTPAAGASAQLVTLAHSNGPEGDADPARPLANIRSVAGFNNPVRMPAQSSSQHLTRFAGLSSTTPVTQRTLYFSTNLSANPPQFFITVDGQTPAVFNMDNPPSIVVNGGTVEEWTIQNRSKLSHSFHIHQLHFQVVDPSSGTITDPTLRDTIDLPYWSGNSSDPYPSVTLLMDFRDPNIVGTFVYHCHILAHEDLGMMASIQVLPGATATALTAPAGSSYGATVTLNATVSAASGIGTPGGSVTFSKGTSSLGTATIDSSGNATFQTAALSLGSSSITATYSGSSEFAASTSSASTVTVAPATTTTALVASPTSVSSGSSVKLTATVTASPSSVGTPTGQVSFVSGTATLGTATLNSSGVATYSTSALPTGTASITAAYAGASTFATSTSTAANVSVTSAASSGLQFVAVTPCRVVDTRNAAGTFGGPELAAATTRQFNLPQSACGIPTSAVAYSLNVTVVPDGSLNYLTLWPSGQTQPGVSTLNSDGRVKANAAMVPAGTSGGVSVYVSDATQVILDIDGYFAPPGTTSALAFYPVTPCRVADTRQAAGSLGGPYLGGGSTRNLPIRSSSCGLPATAAAYSLNVTAVPHHTLNYLSMWPTGASQPNVSTLNASTGTVTANAAVVPAGNNGDVSLFVSDDSDVILDVNGYFAPPATGGLSLYTTNPCRVLDTRPSAFNGTSVVNVESSVCAPPPAAKAYVLNTTVVPSGELIYLSLWPDGGSQPNVSTLNAYDGAISSNMAIVPVTNGSVDAFADGSTNFIVDISSYFAP